MKILVAEYASALGLGGTVELEGRAMLAALVKSFARSGHDVIYPTGGLKLDKGQPVLIKTEEDFEAALLERESDAGLLIAPDGMQPHLLQILRGIRSTWGQARRWQLLRGTSCSAPVLWIGRELPWPRSWRSQIRWNGAACDMWSNRARDGARKEDLRI